MRIGIPTGYYTPTFGIHGMYVDWVAQFGQPILLTPYVDQYDQFDVLFLPGGSDISDSKTFVRGRSNPHLEWFDRVYIYKCIQYKKPIFGVCRGFQRINSFFGGTLRNLYGEELALHQQNKDEATKNSLVHEIKIHPDYTKMFELNKESFETTGTEKVNSIHHQAIDKLGDGLKVLAKCGNVIEAFKYRNLPICGVQWHPEKINDEFSRKLFKSII